MVLINAIYFKGIWKKTFDKKRTIKNNFNNLNKNPKKVDFMNSTEKYDYIEINGVQVISLNYQKDNMKALIILPKREDDINIFIDNFKLEKYNEIIKNLKNVKVELYLPKFEVNFEVELKSSFISMGIVEAFSDNADFSVMNKNKILKIGRIIHKTFIKVDEEGTEAAAATAVVMRCLDYTSTPEKIYFMNINRPFLFFIRTNDLPQGHDILFITKVESL